MSIYVRKVRSTVFDIFCPENLVDTTEFARFGIRRSLKENREAGFSSERDAFYGGLAWRSSVCVNEQLCLWPVSHVFYFITSTVDGVSCLPLLVRPRTGAC